MADRKSKTAPKEQAAACGLFCRACRLYIGTLEDPVLLEKIAQGFNMDVEDVKCEGCHSDRIGFYCRTCKMLRCTEDKGIEFCSLCDEYPCAELEEFQAAKAHRIELWNDLARLKEVGYDQWYEEKMAFYSCPDCGAVNTAYDIKCRQCGREPSCDYTAKHAQTVLGFLSR